MISRTPCPVRISPKSYTGCGSGAVSFLLGVSVLLSGRVGMVQEVSSGMTPCGMLLSGCSSRPSGTLRVAEGSFSGTATSCSKGRSCRIMKSGSLAEKNSSSEISGCAGLFSVFSVVSGVSFFSSVLSGASVGSGEPVSTVSFCCSAACASKRNSGMESSLELLVKSKSSKFKDNGLSFLVSFLLVRVFFVFSFGAAASAGFSVASGAAFSSSAAFSVLVFLPRFLAGAAVSAAGSWLSGCTALVSSAGAAGATSSATGSAALALVVFFFRSKFSPLPCEAE